MRRIQVASKALTEIRFYARDRKAYPFLSNFYMPSLGIVIDGTHWPSTEHFYQAEKFSNHKHRAMILRAPRPGLAKRLARTHREFMRPDWDAVKLDVMLKALRAKFAIPYLRYLLVRTGDAILVEDSPGDSFWGSGADGKGQNHLGNLLMQVREEAMG